MTQFQPGDEVEYKNRYTGVTVLFIVDSVENTTWLGVKRQEGMCLPNAVNAEACTLIRKAKMEVKEEPKA